MHHLTDDELVLIYYGESPRTHVDDCAECRFRFQKLQRLLNTMDAAPAPERGAGYGARVWATIQASESKRAARIGWGWVGAIAAAALFAVFLQSEPHAEPLAMEEVRSRVLDAALDSHFESTRIALTEIVNDDAARIDAVEDLLADNRLFRQSAHAAGEAESEKLLEDLEEVLVEAAHAPTGLPELRQRIEKKGVLFALRVRAAKEGSL